VRALRIILVFAFVLTGAAQAKDPEIAKPGPDNFGLVVHNKHFTIYRSAALGRSGLARLAERLKRHNLPFPKTIIYMNRDGYSRTLWNPTLFAIEEFEDSPKYGFEFYHSFRHDYSTYLDTYDPSRPSRVLDAKDFLNSTAIRYFGYWPHVRIDGGMTAFYRILDLVLESKGPVLFHCTGGHHRTGMIALAIRYLQGGSWTSGKYQGPLRRMHLNKAQYEYYKHNTFLLETSNLDFIEAWSKTEQFQEYQKRYSHRLNEESL